MCPIFLARVQPIPRAYIFLRQKFFTSPTSVRLLLLDTRICFLCVCLKGMFIHMCRNVFVTFLKMFTDVPFFFRGPEAYIITKSGILNR